MTTPARGQVVDQVIGAVLDGRSVVLRGAMGVGKTHLLGEAVVRLRRDGWRCTNINANGATATIPFGALAEFAVDEEVSNRPAVLRSITQALRSLGDGRPHLIAIDDAPLLDDQSVAVFHQLLGDPDVHVIATSRSSDRESIALTDLWHHLDCDRIEVQPLDDHDATSLLHERLGHEVESSKVARIVQRAEGNPLFLIELARAAIDDKPDGLTRRLRDVVGDRIARLDEDARTQLRFVAVADPFDTDLDIADATALELLEAAGLITTAEVVDGVVARPAHPLYGEIVRDSLTPLQRKEVSRRLSSGLSNDPRTRRGDALRLAGWLLACGDKPSVELAVPAAREAISLLNVDLANELVGIATASEPGFDALFVAGEVARLTGDIDRALEWFDRAFAIAEDSSDLRAVALAMGQIYGFYRNRPDEAVRVLSAAADRMTDETQWLELEIERVLFGSMLGRYADVLDAAERVLQHPGCGAETRWTACTNVAWAEVQLIDLRNVHGHLDAAFALIDQFATERAGEVDLVRAVRINVLVEEGRLGDALSPDRFIDTDEAPNGLTRFAASQAALMAGDATRARHLMDGAIDQLRAFDAFNAYPFVRAGSAILASISGDSERAALDMEASIARGGGTGMWDQLWLSRARAWSEMAAGRPEDAVAVLFDGARDGIDTSHYGWSALSLHDAVGWGAASVVADTFRALREEMHGAPLMECLADSAMALASGDLDATRRHVDTLLGFGSWWHAGVVSSALGLVLHDLGKEVEACRAATSAMVWLPPQTPQVASIREIALSPRRLDVVRSALCGRTDREIADSLFLSARTVSNHLGAVYSSLGVAGRSELFALLSPSGAANHRGQP